MLMVQEAPGCERFVGSDFSEALKMAGLPRRRPTHDELATALVRVMERYKEDGIVDDVDAWPHAGVVGTRDG